MIAKTISLLVSVLFCLAGSAQVDTNLHLYLLAGQSNMAGRGEVSGKYATQGDPALLMLDKNNEWVPAKNPLHFDKPRVAGVGPGMSFGLAMVAGADSKIRIGLVPCAVGGSSIEAWKPGAYDSATKTHPYDDAMKRIAIAMKQGVFKGVLWHQGESDSDPAKAALYLPKLVTLIAAFRTAMDDANLPVVVGELGPYREVYANINRVLATLPQAVTHTAVASSKDLVHKGDQTHFDSPSAETFGIRFATEMKRLQAEK